VLGNFLTLKEKAREKKYLHEAVAAMARERNTSVLGLKLKTELTVVVFGFQMAKQVCTREVFERRPDTFLIRLRAMGGRGGAFT